MSQKLLLPFDCQMILCGYKTARYRQEWGYDHYGYDISTIQGGASGNHEVYAGGEGRVYAAGYDNSLGNVVVVIYPDVYNHKTGKSCDLVARYGHLASISVKEGQAVNRDTVLGIEGKTATSNYHLHVEFETDTKWPLYSPQVSSRDDAKSRAEGNLILKGPVDATVNPAYIFHQGPGRVLAAKNIYAVAWRNPEDSQIPKLEDTCPGCAARDTEIAALKNKIAAAQRALAEKE